MKTQKRKEKLIHAIAALVMAITLSSCVTMGMSSSRVQMTGRIHQGQTYQEVTSIMKKETYSSFCRLKSVIPFDIYSCFAHSR